jgi:NADH-quinone oxidoreductase subunit E
LATSRTRVAIDVAPSRDAARRDNRPRRLRSGNASTEIHERRRLISLNAHEADQDILQGWVIGEDRAPRVEMAMQSLPSHSLSDAAKHFIDKVILQENGRAGALLAILQRVQDSHARKFLPRETLEYISLKANVPQSRLFSVVTFYALFNLEPQGRDTVSVCRGTACHTRGSSRLLEQVMMSLGLHAAEDGETDKLTMTTADGETTLRTVACFGQCALAPVVEVNHAIFGHMNERSLQRELEALDKRETRP